jgi:hypothetical protein
VSRPVVFRALVRQGARSCLRGTCGAAREAGRSKREVEDVALAAVSLTCATRTSQVCAVAVITRLRRQRGQGSTSAS